MRRGGAARLIGLGACALASPAWSDAFLEPVGSGKIIVTGRFETGRLPALNPATYSKFVLSTLVEVGVGPDVTMIGRADGGVLQWSDATWRGAVGLGLRTALARRDDWTLALEATAGGGPDADAPPGARSAAWGDLRLAGGVNFSLFDRPAFATLSAGARASPAVTQARVDATLGWRWRDDLLVLAQSFHRTGGGAAHTLQTSLVWSVSPQWSVQGGVYAAAGGRRQGAFTALWRRF